MGIFIDLSNERFGRLTVLKQSTNRGRLVQWCCKCDCGNETLATTKKLRNGRKQSCGCLWYPAIVKAKTKHGHSADGTTSAELKAWMSLRNRCNNPMNRSYHRYGGRGIKVCERWDDFSNFLADMGPRPSVLHSIDRIENNSSYSPDNCRWATKTEQARNKGSTVLVNYGGKIMCVKEVSVLCGVGQGTILYRIHAGWPEHRLFVPPHG